jgi:hypothetical protein
MKLSMRATSEAYAIAETLLLISLDRLRIRLIDDPGLTVSHYCDM